MIAETLHSDVLVIGSGPAGQKAAVQASKAGRKAMVIERDPCVGGSCVRQGTIPSKTLREIALALTGLRRRSGAAYDIQARGELRIEGLLSRLREVVEAHERYMERQLGRNGVRIRRGRAHFVSPHELEITASDGTLHRAIGDVIVIATGSRPRSPPEIEIDHEHVLDSDSILTMHSLPDSLTVIGSGVIASEYASIFSNLGVHVTLVDRAHQPVAFLDPELTQRFVESFERSGGRYLGGQEVEKVAWDGQGSVVTKLVGASEVWSEKVLCALGRTANLDGLRVEAAGLQVNARGFLQVDEHYRTEVPHIYAAGDVGGPPALASSAMEQGRRAVCHALNLPIQHPIEMMPIGVYTIPEMSSVGLTEAQVIERFGSATVGRSRFDELARGQIAALEGGLLKMVADPPGHRLLGVQIVGEGAAELIHVGQMALLGGLEIDAFVDNIFNFPTLAEGYRVAALDIANRRAH